MANEFKIKKGLIVTGADGGTVVDIQGSQGQLFSVTDDLSGSIFAVSDISGVPILDVNSNGTSYFDGNVGIGTDSPTAPLHIEGGTNGEVLKIEADANPYIRWVENGTDVGFLQFLGESAYLSNMGDGSFFFRTNNSDKMTITSSGNVGIGTTSPNEKLDVAGKVYIESQGVNWNETTPGLVRGALHFDPVGDGADNTGNAITFGASDYTSGENAQAGIYTRSDGNYGTKMYFATSDSYSIGSKTSMMINYNGNVGIGTNSPERKLHVFAGESNGATSNTQSTLVLENSTNTYLQFLTPGYSDSGILFGDTDNDRGALIYSHSADAMNFRVAAETKMYINSSGNVGIGTTSPDAQLEISNLDAVTGQGGATLRLTRADLSAAAGDPVGTIDFYSTDADGPHTTAYIKSMSEELYGRKGSLAFGVSQTLNTDATEAMRIDSNGNVGIGTTSPNGLLRVYGTGRTFNATSTSDQVVGSITRAGGSVSTLGFNGTGSTSDYHVRIGADATSFVAYAGNIERMRITSAGYVGIGTTSPSEKLEVHSANAKITANSTADSQTVGFEAKYMSHSSLKGTFHYTTGDARLWIDNHFTGNNGNYSDIIFRNKNVGGDQLLKERLIIKGTSGNVGIGVTNPGVKLDVAGTVRSYSSAGNYGQIANGSFQAVGAHGGTFMLDLDNTSTADLVNIKKSGSSRFYIQNGGNVGIGTTTFPTTAIGERELLVQGAIVSKPPGVEDYYSYLKSNWANDGAFELGIQGADTNHKFITSSNYYHGTQLNFHTSDQKRMVIDSNGNVGIGTTSPDRKIHVEGGYYLKGGAANTSYVADGLWGATATPNLLNSTSGGLGLRIGYQDNGSGLYSPAYGFEVKSTDGIPVAGRVQRAIVIKDVDTGLYPFYINNNGSAFFNGNVGIGTTSPVQHQSTTETVLHIANGNVASLNLDAGGTNGDCYVLSSTSGGNFSIYNDDTNTTAFIIDDASNVGIGTTSPNAKLDVQGTQGQLFSVTDDLSGDIFSVADISGVPIMNVNSDGTSYFDGNVGIGTDSPGYPLVVNGEIDASGDGYLIKGYGWAYLDSSETLLTLGDWDGTEFSTRIMDQNSSEVLRVTDGRVGIGTTGPLATLHIDNPQTANGNIGFISDASAGGTGTRNMHINLPNYGEGIRFLRSGTYSGGAMKFYNGTSNVGGVQINTSSTSFNTTSDYRAKENVVPMENSINRLKELKPCRFNFIIEPENTVDGFIAHEAQEVVPEAITGEKDKLNYEGNPEYQGIDQSKIVPLLTAALQEAISKIEQLETRIQTLENN